MSCCTWGSKQPRADTQHCSGALGALTYAMLPVTLGGRCHYYAIWQQVKLRPREGRRLADLLKMTQEVHG